MMMTLVHIDRLYSYCTYVSLLKENPIYSGVKRSVVKVIGKGNTGLMSISFPPLQLQWRESEQTRGSSVKVKVVYTTSPQICFGIITPV